MRTEQSAEVSALPPTDPGARVFEPPARVLGAPQDLVVDVFALPACTDARGARAAGCKARCHAAPRKITPSHARVISRTPFS